MSHIVLEPEVAGGWGSETIADTSRHPPVVSRLHYEFEGWLGDDLLESFPCFIVTERLAVALERAGLTGFVLDDVTTTRSPEFEELYPDTQLPSFRWLRVTAHAGTADFGIGPDYRLVVSTGALTILERFELKQAGREPFVRG